MGKATKRMIEFATDIADELGLDYPDFDDFEETSDFISDNKEEYYQAVNDERW
jgi:hypothetical protein